MNKNESALIKAIKNEDKAEALELFAKVQEIKTISDEQKETYFNQIESLGVEQGQEVDVVEQLDIEAPIEVIDEEIKPETRGRKAKNTDRMELERDLNLLITKALSFNAKVSRNGNGDSSFARRLVTQLSATRKRLVR